MSPQKIGYVDAMPCSALDTELSFHLWVTLMETTHAYPQITRHTKLRWLQSLFPSTPIKTFAKLRRTQSLARPTTRAAFSTLSYLHFVSLLTIFPTRLAAQKANPIFHAANKKLFLKTFRLRDLEPSPLYTQQALVKDLTNFARKQLNVNTHIRYNLSSLTTKIMAKH